MPKRPQGIPNPVSTPKAGRLITWFWGAVLIAALGGLAALGYLYRQPVLDSAQQGRDTVVTYVGLGIVPITAWLVASIWVVTRRRRWLRRPDLWVGSLTFLAVAMGVMGFFAYDSGFLSTFTVDGEVRLGGKLGTLITGPMDDPFGEMPVWASVVRVGALLVIGASLAAPRVARGGLGTVAKAGMFTYLLLALGLRKLLSGAGRIYRYDPPPRPRTGRPRVVAGAGMGGSRSGLSHVAAGSTPIGPEASWRAPSADVTPEIASSERAGLPLLATEDVPAAAQEAATTASNGPGQPDVPAVFAPDTGSGEPEAVAAPANQPGKFNRFWTEGPLDAADNAPLSNGSSGVAATAEPEPNGIPARGANPSGDGPILSTGVDLWARPSIDLLSDAPEGGISKEEMDETADSIRRTLGDYGVDVEIGQVRPGPTVTMYGLVPGWIRKQKQVRDRNEDGSPRLNQTGKQIVRRVEEKTRVKVDSILSREKDLALALKTPSIRIETPVMGQSMLGIEVPNLSSSLVTVRSVMESNEFKTLRVKAHLPVALGKGSGGETAVIDLAKMPHLLIAGATGSGKSVCINTIVSCLIMEKTPEQLRLLLIDPKRVELTPYNGIPHLLAPVVVETDEVVGYLKGLIAEMLNRYRLMEDAGVRNIEAFNERMPEKMPFLVVAIDELADLMMTASYDVEQSLCRLAQLGRATGIHLIVATQRPSVDVVTGLIKANFPSRISFAVTSQIDSRTILDSSGADKLLGRGDMLYLPIDGSRPERIQGVFMDDSEVDEVVRHWETTTWPPLRQVSLRALAEEAAVDGDGQEAEDREDRDELIDKAIELAHSHNKFSTSLLQRRLRIGYPRAARLMDQLEDEGIVGPSDGSKSRDVIINSR